MLDELRLGPAYAERVASLRRLIDAVTVEIDIVGRRVSAQWGADRGYRAVQALDGVGPVVAAVFVAEIGDVTRCAGPAQLCSWAGMTPRHRESDTKVHRGRITQQGNRLVRWAAVEGRATRAPWRDRRRPGPHRRAPRRHHRHGRRRP
jgi:transposase